MWPERKDLAAAFTFLVLLALSAFGCLGANSEVLYAPYVLLTGAFPHRGSVLSAALAAAVAVNIKYPVGLDVIGVARFLIVAASLGVWGLLSGARLDRSARGGLLVRAAFSLLQAVITGTTYYHYFIPVYLPLSALLVSHWRTGQRVPWRRASVTLGAVLALATLGDAAAKYGHLAKAREDLASGVCPHLRGRTVYVADELLATYRICNLRPSKFMFPPFVFQQHTVQVAGSEGLGELEAFEVVLVSPESRFAPRVRASRDGDVVELPVRP